MTNRFCKGTVFNATSTADLLANQPKYHHMNVDENDVDTVATTQVLQLEKQVGLSGSVSLIVGTMIGSEWCVQPGWLCWSEFNSLARLCYNRDARCPVLLRVGNHDSEIRRRVRVHFGSVRRAAGISV